MPVISLGCAKRGVSTPVCGLEARVRYSFEDFELDTDQRELRRDGVVVPVEPLTFDILAVLIRERARVVGKEDLRTEAWSGRIVSDSTLSSAITAVRAAVNDNGEAQRLIRTIPRRGFRFVGTLRDVPGEAAAEAAAAEPQPRSQPPSGRPSARMRPRLIAAAIGTAVVALAAGVFVGSGEWHRRPARLFDPTTVPLVNDETRRGLASYRNRPDAKALALASDTLAVADGAPDDESAKREALRLCGARSKRQCSIYAVGMEVLWSNETVPAPAAIDLHTVPLSERLTPEELPTLGNGLRQQIARNYLGVPVHKALAIATGVAWFITQRGSAEEAIRMTVEQCSFAMLRPCLLVAVDDFLTVRMPKSHNAVGIFLPSTDPDIPAAERSRIATIYKDPDWRAVARGSDGTWHAVAGLASEDVAADAALQACQGSGRSCALFAVGNFRVTR
jgi:DNA-binding winged helix-turn-helix (wHTH) protein